MSHLMTGRVGKFEWLECLEQEFDIHMLLTRCPESVLGKCIVVAAFDSGPLKPSAAELTRGWEDSADLLIVPKVEDVTLLPYDNYDEWYVFPDRETPVIEDRFVNYDGFTLRDPNLIFEENVSAMGEQADIVGERHYAEWLGELQRRYWEQIIRTNPESYIACGYRFLFVSRSNEVFAAVREAASSNHPA